MKTALLYPLLFLSASAGAQAGSLPVSFSYAKLSAYSNRFQDAFSFTSNQAVLAAAKRFSAGVYGERRFLQNALSAYSAAFVLPTSSGNIGWKGDYFGNPAYNESALGLAYAKALGSMLALGVQFNYFRITTAGYGSAGTVNFDAGAIFHLTPQLNAGLHVFNPVSRGWGKDGMEKLPAIYNMGLGFEVSPQVFVGAEIEKAEDRSVSVNAGLHYQPVDQLIVRVGLQSAASIYYIGLGLQRKHFRFDVTASLHPYLGLTPGLLLLYAPKE